MRHLAPVGDVYQAGTLSGTPLATAAGTSVLRRLRAPAIYAELARRGGKYGVASMCVGGGMGAAALFERA